MSQDQVYQILENADKPLTSIEIREKLDLNISSIRTALMKLIKWGEVKRIIIKHRTRNQPRIIYTTKKQEK